MQVQATQAGCYWASIQWIGGLLQGKVWSAPDPVVCVFVWIVWSASWWAWMECVPRCLCPCPAQVSGLCAHCLCINVMQLLSHQAVFGLICLLAAAICGVNKQEISDCDCRQLFVKQVTTGHAAQQLECKLHCATHNIAGSPQGRCPEPSIHLVCHSKGLGSTHLCTENTMQGGL